MTMPPFSQQHSSDRIPENPEIYAGSLAHILHKENGKMAIVGQAWIAGSNKLVTCGHVVEPFLKDSAMLAVKFPASGAEYTIDSIRLHPNFTRQDDQLVKFDAAVLSVRFRGQELSARALPLKFEQTLKNQDTLWTVRYPAHLGALSSAPDPLKQSGLYLGRLRKQDNYHILHDLALAPGDSGAALFSQQGVVGIHCGDTASLPGLNLPTTSIRMGLWVDALKELGIERSIIPTAVQQKSSLPNQIGVALLAGALTLGFALTGLAAIYASQQKATASQLCAPVSVCLSGASQASPVPSSIDISLTEPSHLYVVFKKGSDKTFVIYPTKEQISRDEKASGLVSVSLPSDLKGDWQSGAGELFVMSVPSRVRLLVEGDLVTSAGKTFPLVGDTGAFWTKVKDNQSAGAAVSREIAFSNTAIAE